MKELIGKSGIDKLSFPQKIVVNKTEIVGETRITNEFSKFFINVGPKLVPKIPQQLKRFESYMKLYSSRKFPNSLKIENVTPIYKAGDSRDLDNYRSVCVIPCFSKILERIIYNRVYTYL